MIPQNKASPPQKTKKKSAIVALSGGVDSAVAAYLLKKSGAAVSAVFMQNWRDDDETAACHDKDDLLAAVAVAERLAVEIAVLDFAAEYRRRVFEPFLRELRRGRTPNPDVLCNSGVKFEVLRRRLSGGEVLATGHYAGRSFVNDEWRLLKGEDSAKDQSYFLHRLSGRQLAAADFPLAGWHKADVRTLARECGLHNWARKDSTGICFIGERRFRDFIKKYLPPSPGPMRTPDGKTVGEHEGLPYYTIGQRQGLGIGGGGAAWFVATKHSDDNVLEVVQGENHPRLFSRTVQVEDTHWISAMPPRRHWVYAARLRHRHFPASCTLTAVGEGTATIAFAEPQRAAAPGQYAVVYDGNVCLGGGVICGAE